MEIDDSGETPTVRTNNSTPGHWQTFTVDVPPGGRTGPTQNPTDKKVGDASRTLNKTIERVKKRLTGDCAKLFPNLNTSDYLANNLTIASEHPDGDAFLGELNFAATFPSIENGKPTGQTVFNLNSGFFTGTVKNQPFPGTIVTKESSAYGLSLDEIRELALLHELFHVADTAGEFDDATPNDDAENKRKSGAINKLLRQNCGFPTVKDDFGK